MNYTEDKFDLGEALLKDREDSGELAELPEAEEKKERETKVDRVINMALERYELFCDEDRKGYATLTRDNHKETFPLRSTAFRTALSGDYWEMYKKGIGGQVIQDATSTLEGHAIHAGPCYPVYVRLAEHNGVVCLDLGNADHEVVEITAGGWRILSNQNVVKFLRPKGMTSLPYPRPGGNLDTLRKYINLLDDEDWPVLVGYILMCLNPWGPYPILSFTGEQGSAKSTGQKVIKALLDQSSAPLRSLPKDTRDLAIASRNGFILAYDNLSNITGSISDAFCRLSTGAGFATRTLYSDDEETIINTRRPVMINGIENVIRRHDLADRTIIITLAPIPDNKRIAEADFWQDFEDDAPEILGAILDAASCALRNHKQVTIPRVPRMADFAVWATAAEPALGWNEGTFIKAYLLNRQEVVACTLEADLVGSAVRTFMDSREAWEGTATELLNLLDDQIDERVRKGKGWPSKANVLSEKLKRSAPALRTEGIEVDLGGRSNRRKFIRIEKGAKKIVTIVTGAISEMQSADITKDSKVTVNSKIIVTGSSPMEADRHPGDDDPAGSDDGLKKIVTGQPEKELVKTGDYKSGDGRDDGDDDSRDFFKNPFPQGSPEARAESLRLISEMRDQKS